MTLPLGDQIPKTERVCERKGLFTWREKDPNSRKIREGGKTFRLLYIQKFRPRWLPNGEGKEE